MKNEELLYTVKLLSAILFNAYLGKKIKFGIENILTLYGFVQLIYCFYNNNDERNNDNYF